MEWYIYIIRGNDNSLYTGISTNVLRRYKEHHGKRGAKYLRGKKPLELVYYYRIGDKSEALRIERKIKKLSKHKKELLISDKISISDI